MVGALAPLPVACLWRLGATRGVAGATWDVAYVY